VKALGSQTKYWRLIVQYGKSQEATDRLTAEQRRIAQLERNLAWCGENGFEPIAIGAAA
jgi:hypothetical protein